MKPTLLLTLMLCTCLPAAHAADPFDTLIPYPRKLAPAGGPVPLDEFQLLIGPSPEARLGAEEINQRIESLSEKRLPIEKIDDQLPAGNLIIIVTCDAPVAGLESLPGQTVTPRNPGEQGYVIRPEKRDDGSFRLWLLGSDPLGTLYAAVTTRQLIGPSENGLALRPATITDWPDYKKRQLGYPMNEPRRGLWYAMKRYEDLGELDQARTAAQSWIARKKTHYDWMLRAKINWAWSHTFIKEHDTPEKSALTRGALKEVNDYGLKRGIRTMVTGTSAIGRFPEDQGNPDFKHVAYHRSHHRYFCWSRLNYHQRQAQRIARMVADCGYRGYYLHAADGGGWRNPGLWNDRCPKCRETYGDDHAQADAVVFGIYYDAIRKLVPDCEFVAVVYPYSPDSLNPESVYRSAAAEMGAGEATRRLADQRTDKLTSFLQRLDTLLPKDIYVTVREAQRSSLDKMRAAWGRRRFHTYFEFSYWKGWQPYFTTTPLWIRSLYYPAHEDILFGNINGHGWHEIEELLGAECAWNVNRPGAKDFSEVAWKEFGTRQPPPPERAQFASRACRFWFGEKMGPLIAPVFAENVSLEFIVNPDKVIGRIDIPDPLATMTEQVAATGRAARSLDQACALQEAESILAGEDLGFFFNMLLMTHGAHLTAEHRARILQIRVAIDRSDREEAARLITAAKAALRIAGGQWQALTDRVPKEQLMFRYTRRRGPYGYLSKLDISEFQKEVDALSNNYEQLIIERTMPAWFRSSVDRRHLTVGRAKNHITIDGRLDEATWLSAQPASNFIFRERLQLESHETQARLAFDDAHLYVSFECHEPAADERVLFGIADQKESKESRHWIVEKKAGSRSLRHVIVTDDEPVKLETTNSMATMKASTRANVWTVEMAIPLDELGFKMDVWRSSWTQLARQSKAESTAFAFLHGDPPYQRKHFVQARWTEDKDPRTPMQIRFNVDALDLRHETIGSGSGTVIDGVLSLLVDRPLHQVRVSVEATDGIRPLGKQPYPPVKRVPLIWRPDSPFVMRFAEEIPGVVAHFMVTADEGEWSFTRRFGSPRRATEVADDLFTEGVGGGKAIRDRVHFASVGPEQTPWPEGTIEFWIKPNWKSVSHGDGPKRGLENAIIHMGPIRPEAPTQLHLNALGLFRTSSGYLIGSLASSHYRHRNASSNIGGWKPGQWHHVAMQWKRDDGRSTTIALYLDGKFASNKTQASPQETATQPLVPSQFRPPIQIGSMNTGIRPADAAIDELRISSVRRYSADFEPDKRLAADDKTLALFHFDGNLDAEFPSGLVATAGAVQ